MAWSSVSGGARRVTRARPTNTPPSAAMNATSAIIANRLRLLIRHLPSGSRAQDPHLLKGGRPVPLLPIRRAVSKRQCQSRVREWRQSSAPVRSSMPMRGVRHRCASIYRCRAPTALLARSGSASAPKPGQARPQRFLLKSKAEYARALDNPQQNGPQQNGPQQDGLRGMAPGCVYVSSLSRSK